MAKSSVAQQVKALPSRPGVYHYYDSSGKLLYIGKATSLKRRVGSYFNRPQEPRIAELIQRIARIEYTETGSVIEALFLEAYLINSHQPPFNIRLKDNKTFATIVLTDEPFPRLLVTRPTQKLRYKIKHEFGPYTSSELARNALTIVRRILPFRTTCQDQTRDQRGCLDYQLGLCPGPCAGAITKRDYAAAITKVRLFLEGKKNILSKRIKKEMDTASKTKSYEQAAKLRDQLHALDHIRDVALIRKESEEQFSFSLEEKNIPHRVEGYDISNIGRDHAVASMVVITDGKKDTNEYRKFQIKTVIGQNDLRMMEEVLFRRFRHLDWPLPTLLVIDGGANHLKVAQKILKRYQLEIPIIAAAKGPERKKLDLYPSNPKLLENKDAWEPAIRLARDEAHRFAITYHRTRRDSHFLVD